MKYVAKYDKAAYEAAKKDFMRMISEDEYYAMYSPLGSVGTKIAHCRQDGLGNYWGTFGIKGLDKTFDTLGDVKEGDIFPFFKKGGWESCSENDNRIIYHFDHETETVVVVIEGRRHGIPSDALRDYKPETVYLYETYCLEWHPWDTMNNQTWVDVPSDKRWWIKE